MNRIIVALVLGASISSANAALINRGGGLIYDDVLGITWLQDANYAMTSGFDVDGMITWDTAVGWVDSLVYSNSGGTYADWRLPTVIDTGSVGCPTNDWAGTDCGWNVDTSTGEMASLFYDTLGNLAYYDTSGSPQSGSGLSNTGPFTNLQSHLYWTGTDWSPTGAFINGFGGTSGTPGSAVWAGLQSIDDKTHDWYAWAVRDGDVAAVPIPAAFWLFGSALGLLGWMHRKAAY